MKFLNLFLMSFLVIPLNAMEDPSDHEAELYAKFKSAYPTNLTDFDFSYYSLDDAYKFQRVEPIYFSQFWDTERDRKFIKTIWYLAHKEEPYPPALYLLGLMRLHGWKNFKADYQESIQFFSQAVHLGHPQSKYELGLHYIRQAAVPCNVENKVMYQWMPAASIINFTDTIPLGCGMATAYLPQPFMNEHKNLQLYHSLMQASQNDASLVRDSQDGCEQARYSDIPKSQTVHKGSLFKNEKPRSKKKLYSSMGRGTLLQKQHVKSYDLESIRFLANSSPSLAIAIFKNYINKPVLDEGTLNHVLKTGAFSIVEKLSNQGNRTASYVLGFLWQQVYYSGFSNKLLKKINKTYPFFFGNLAQITKVTCAKKSMDYYLKALQEKSYNAIESLIKISQFEPEIARDSKIYPALCEQYLSGKLPAQLGVKILEYFLEKVGLNDEAGIDDVEALQTLLIIYVETNNTTGLLEVLKKLSTKGSHEVLQQLKASSTLKIVDTFFENNVNPLCKYYWGKCLRNWQAFGEGDLHIIHAAEKCDIAAWYYVALLLESENKDDEARALKLLRGLMNKEFNYEVELSKNINQVVELLKNRSQDNINFVRMLGQMYEKGIGKCLVPDLAQANLYKALSTPVHNVQVAEQVSVKVLTVKSEDISKKDIKDVFVYIQTQLKLEKTLSADDVKVIKHILDAKNISVKECYDFAKILLNAYEDLAIQAIVQAEEFLSVQSKTNQQVPDGRLKLIKTCGLYDSLHDLVTYKCEIVGILLKIVALRCERGVCLLDDDDISQNYARAYDYMMLVNEHPQARGLTPDELKNIQQKLGIYFYEQGQFSLAQVCLSNGCDEGDFISTGYYALTSLQSSDHNKYDSGVAQLENLLSYNHEAPLKVLPLAQKALLGVYRERLSEVHDSTELVKLREKILKKVKLFGEYGNEISKQIMSDVAYYTLDEVIELHLEKAQAGDTIALWSIAEAYEKAGKNNTAFEYYEKAALAGLDRAYLKLAFMTFEHNKKSSNDVLIYYVKKFLDQALLSKNNYDEEAQYVSSALSFLHTIAQSACYEADYLCAYYLARMYQLTNKEFYLKKAVKVVLEIEDALVKNSYDGLPWQVGGKCPEKFIYSLGVIDLFENIAFQDKKSQLIIHIGDVYYNRFLSKLPILEKREDDLARAIDCYEKAKAWGYEEDKISRLLAKLYFKYAKLQSSKVKVLSLYTKALENDVRFVKALCARGQLLLEFPGLLGKTPTAAYKQALADFKIAGYTCGFIKAQAQYADALIHAGRLKLPFAKNGVADGRALLEELIKQHASIDATMILSKLYIEGDLLPEDLDEGERLILDVSADSIYTQYLLGVCYFKKARNASANAEKTSFLSKSLKAFESIENFLDHDDERYFNTHLYLTKIYLMKDKPAVAKALECFEKALLEYRLQTKKNRLLLEELAIINDAAEYESNCNVAMVLGVYYYYKGQLEHDARLLTIGADYLIRLLEQPNDVVNDYARAVINAHCAIIYASILREMKNPKEENVRSLVCKSAIELLQGLKLGYVDGRFSDEVFHEAAMFVTNVLLDIAKNYPALKKYIGLFLAKIGAACSLAQPLIGNRYSSTSDTRKIE